MALDEAGTHFSVVTHAPAAAAGPDNREGIAESPQCPGAELRDVFFDPAASAFTSQVEKAPIDVFQTD